MNYSEMKEFVRSHADTDSIDAPDANLDVYARAAYHDIKRRTDQWDEYHISDTLTTTAGTVSYDLTGSGFTGQNIDRVTSIVGGTDVLRFLPWTEYLELRSGSDLTYQTVEADYWTVKDGSVFLYPDPSTSGETYTVYGYSTWSSWPSGSTAPPLPEEFHEPICWFMLAKYYQAQEDLQLASIMMNDYETAVNRMLKFSRRRDAHAPRVLGGVRRRRLGYGNWVRRNTEG